MNQIIFSEDSLKELARSVFNVDYILDKDNIELFNAMCKYFSGGYKSTLNPSKGLLIMGPVGTGKTLMLRLFSEAIIFRNSVSKYQNGEFYLDDKIDDYRKFYIPLHDTSGKYSNMPIYQPRGFNILPARHLAKQFSNEGYGGLDIYCNENNYNNICIDDLGLEPELSYHYGDKCNIIEQVLLDRYDMYSESQDSKTYATTNLGKDSLLKLYGDRVMSRINEMMNIVTLAGIDRRK